MKTSQRKARTGSILANLAGMTMLIAVAITLSTGTAQATGISTTDSTAGVSGIVNVLSGGAFVSTDLPVKNTGATSQYTRKAYIRLDTSTIDLPVTEASLSLVVSDNALGGYAQYISLYGFTDETIDTATLDNSLTWATAPGNDTTSGEAPDLTKATLLSQKFITGTGGGGAIKLAVGDTLTFNGQALIDFLNANSNGIVTFMVGRVYLGTFVDGRNLAFAGDTNTTYAAPSLTVMPSGDLPLVQHGFNGVSTDPLNGVLIDYIDPSLHLSSGSVQWQAAANFKADGSALFNSTASNGNIRLGSIINDAKGTPDGRFELTATLAKPDQRWMELMFHGDAEPDTWYHHGHGAGSVGGIVYDIDGTLSTQVRGDDNDLPDVATGLSGPRTLTVTLDFTPAGGYDGVTNHGVITWSDSVLGILRQYILPTDAPVGSIILASGVDSSGAGFSDLSLKRIGAPVWFPEPEAAVTADLTLVTEAGYNTLDVTFAPKWPFNPGPDIETTTVSGTLKAGFNVDPRTSSSEIFLMTGAGTVSNTDMHFQKSGLTSYDLTFANMSGNLNSQDASGLRDPATGAFSGVGHQYLINSGSASGTVPGDTFNQDFSQNPFNFGPEGNTGSVTLTPTTQAGGFQNYAVVLTFPLTGTYEDNNDYSVSGVGTLKASGTLSVPLVSDYYNWISTFAGVTDTDPGADNDGDGIKNVMEFVLDGNPEIPNTAILPVVDVNGVGGFVFVFGRRSDSKAITTQWFDSSIDLVDGYWSSSLVPDATSGNVVIEPDTPSAGLERVTVTVGPEAALDGRIFGRMRVSPK